MAFIAGPRQVGKTWLVERLLEDRGSGELYRNWDDLAWRREFLRDPYGFLDRYRPATPGTRPLAALDEIHKYPKWKNYLKGLWDTRKDNIDLIVTGSGRLNIYQKGGDSLLGRYRQYRMSPLSVREIVSPDKIDPEYTTEATIKELDSFKPASNEAKEAFENLSAWSGFPEPFIKANTRNLRLWHRERKDLLVREDLRDLSRIQQLSHVEELVELLAIKAGKVLSYNSLREDLQVALDSVRLWVGYLERLYYVYLLRPYAGKLARALRREPKLYLWDWSEVEDEGARFENIIASHLLKWCQFTQDWGHLPLEFHYVRDREKREVDFLITQDKKPWMLIEAKLSDPTPSHALKYFGERLQVPHKIMLVKNVPGPGRAGDVRVFDPASFLVALPV